MANCKNEKQGIFTYSIPLGQPNRQWQSCRFSVCCFFSFPFFLANRMNSAEQQIKLVQEESNQIRIAVRHYFSVANQSPSSALTEIVVHIERMELDVKSIIVR